jgi:hypothetical protein
LVYDVSRHFQQYFIYIVAITFIGGGKKTTYLSQVTDKLDHIMLCQVHLAMQEAKKKKITAELKHIMLFRQRKPVKI